MHLHPQEPVAATAPFTGKLALAPEFQCFGATGEGSGNMHFIDWSLAYRRGRPNTY